MKYKAIRESWNGTRLFKVGDIIEVADGTKVNHHFVCIDEPKPANVEPKPAAVKPRADK